MACGGSGVVRVKNQVAQGGRNNNEGEGAAGGANRLEDGKAGVSPRNAVLAKVGPVISVDGANGTFGKRGTGQAVIVDKPKVGV